MAERILYGKEEDLVYNRQGRLSPRQSELSARPLRWAAIALALSGVIPLLIGLLLPPLIGMSSSEHTLLAVALSAAAIGLLAGAWFLWRSARRAGERTVEIAEGHLDSLPRGQGGLPPQMRLGERTITVPKANLPLRAGGRYRAYGLPIPRKGVMMTYSLVELSDEGVS